MREAHLGHDHPHGGHDHDPRDGHEHHGGPLGWLDELIGGHSHGAPVADAALEGSDEGIRAVKISLAALFATAALQAIVVAFSGSVALLADTIHNLADALTSIPLWIAFVVGRWPANRRYTYGYGRAEDIAGLAIVLMIALSAALAGWESVRKLVSPEPIQYVGWVIAASIIGFLGNEAVAIYRIRVGKQIGSAALVADGQHARVDGAITTAAGHAVAEEVRHAMLHAAPWLRSVTVHVDPCQHDGLNHHAGTSHHIPARRPTDGRSATGAGAR